MFSTDTNDDYIVVNYHSNKDVVDFLNSTAMLGIDVQRVSDKTTLGGYEYPILDWISEELSGSHYQILKCQRPEPDNDIQNYALEQALEDRNTLYAYPDGNKITIVQFEEWDNNNSTLGDLGVDIVLAPKMFKRIKTFNRPFRAYYTTTDSVKVMLIGDSDFSSYAGFIDEADTEKLLDGAFIISPDIVAKCMERFDANTTVFDEDTTFACNDFNRNVEVGDYYRKSQIFNSRIFGPMHILNEGTYENCNGAIKGQAYTDHSGLCEYYGADIIAPFSAFKAEVNISTRSFFLIEPQNAKLGQMFSDGQTIVNLPGVYDWRHMRDAMKEYYDDMYSRLTSNQVLDQWSDMSFAKFNPDSPKMFDQTDVNSLTTWNVRAWLMCGGKISQSPWLFEQMGKNLLESMRAQDTKKFRFPVPAAARALVISESLLRAIKGLSADPHEGYSVESGTARWDNDMSCLVVNDLDWIEMYPSHGGCDLDDFFMIHWRMINGVKSIIVVRAPNDWGEYSIFKYVPGDWCSTTTYNGETIAFPNVVPNKELWPERLSEAINNGKVHYQELPDQGDIDFGDTYDSNYVLNAINASSAAAASVGINVNARQLWSSTMKAHRQKQLCSMEDCIDAGVQGGTDEQVQAVVAEGQEIIDEIIASKLPIDAYLWELKHSQYQEDADVELTNGNITYLHSVRSQLAAKFKSNYEAFGKGITERSDYTVVHNLGRKYLKEAMGLIQSWRSNIFSINKAKGRVEPNDWEVINENLIITVESYDPGHERNSFIISMYSACLLMPTASGKCSDQLVMQPSLFPVLLEALQFYGQMGRLIAQEDNSLSRTYDGPWDVYDQSECKLITIENPVDFQKWHFANKAATNKKEIH